MDETVSLDGIQVMDTMDDTGAAECLADKENI